MRFTFSWLKRFLDTSRSLEEILQGLNSLGLEVESVTDRSDLKDFKIAHILEAEAHPNASKLKVCRVDDGKQILQVVCGASNARAGIKIVLAPVGSIIPANNMQITLSNIRSVESQGMLCSSDELLLKDKDSFDGIIELDPDAEVGASFMEHHQLNDPVIEIAVTPNRADCLGVYGIARDLHAKGLGRLKELNIPELKSSFTSNKLVEITDSQICSLFIGYEIKNIENKTSPLWLKNLLKNSGLKPISAVVDVTNYVCHSFAQPMHAFDADKINKISIRKAKDLEKFAALNDKIYELHQDDIVIADEGEVHCLAGIIGGKISACSNDTKNIFLEAAYFNKDAITISARRHNIITDSKLRFERHVDDHARLAAAKIACQMIAEICGGDFSELKFIGQLSHHQQIEFQYSLFKKKIGFEIEKPLIKEIISRLGFSWTQKSDDLLVINVPSWRDCRIPEDILEEIIRIYGYEQIPEIKLPDALSIRTLPDFYKIGIRLSSMAAALGYYEVVTWSFMSQNKAEHFDLINEKLCLQNPISNELSYMRSSIVPNLLDAVLRNQNRSIRDLKLFEVGPIFKGITPEDEFMCLTAVSCGKYEPLNAHNKQRNIDIFDIKADLEFLLREFGISFDDIEIKPISKKYYHPNVAAELEYLDQKIGVFGAIHPKLLQEYGVEQDVFAFELDIKLLAKLVFIDEEQGAKPPQQNMRRTAYHSSEYQTIQRDFAFVIDEAIPVGKIVAHIKKIDKTIHDVSVFDIYVGQNIPNGKKSVAVNILMHPNKNLLSEEIEAMCEKIINVVRNDFSGELRC